MLYAILLLILPVAGFSQAKAGGLQFDFYGNTVRLPLDSSILSDVPATPSQSSVISFYEKVTPGHYQPTIDALLAFKKDHQLSDWLYYQLIRKTAQQIAPKAENYPRYTLYKWFFLGKSGYDARLGITKERLIFYVRSDENIYDIPYYMHDGKQYVCLNNHDYLAIDYSKDLVVPVPVQIPEGQRSFSYKVAQMPDFTPADYSEKDLQFSYDNKDYHFKVKVNEQVKTIFTNYPVVDYESYFNIPLSRETYSSLIPQLKKNIEGMDQRKGVDYLMQFTRNAFLYEDDREAFGKEKRLSPEQTLLYQYSDCDDRAALFFYLVKEVYNLPMIALLYPTHITVAVKFDKPEGHTVEYNGEQYSVCEPTPQLHNLRIGQLAPGLRRQHYEVAYAYHPGK